MPTVVYSKTFVDLHQQTLTCIPSAYRNLHVRRCMMTNRDSSSSSCSSSETQHIPTDVSCMSHRYRTGAGSATTTCCGASLAYKSGSCDYDRCIDLHLLVRRKYRAAACDAFELGVVWVQGGGEIWAPDDDLECECGSRRSVPSNGGRPIHKPIWTRQYTLRRLPLVAAAGLGPRSFFIFTNSARRSSSRALSCHSPT
ncbi:hypothetical protein H2248_005258 [Termitomyces sp. 'cryptogamus']|nr:hypothetical protein H2248_005258 [Termitomyces sp. 'cryptogamus']